MYYPRWFLFISLTRNDLKYLYRCQCTFPCRFMTVSVYIDCRYREVSSSKHRKEGITKCFTLETPYDRRQLMRIVWGDTFSFELIRLKVPVSL